MEGSKNYIEIVFHFLALFTSQLELVIVSKWILGGLTRKDRESRGSERHVVGSKIESVADSWIPLGSNDDIPSKVPSNLLKIEGTSKIWIEGF